MPTPTYTTLHQDSTTVFDALGAAKFRVVSSITYVKPGDLPLATGATLSEVFVHSIIDSTDPKQDKFLRVANIHDLTTIVRGRDNALLASQSTYLSLSFTVEFDDVTTAAAAKLVVQTRVDELIADWIKYTTEFLIPTDFPMPAPEATLVVAAKAAYKTAAATSVEKEAALVTANAASTEAVAAAGRASAAYVAALARVNTCNTVTSNANALQTAYNNYRNTMNGFVGVVESTSAVPGINATVDAAYPGALAAKNSELANVQALLTLVVGQIGTNCANEAAAVTAAAVTKATADGTVATTQTAQTQAQAAATAAAAAEAAALAAVLLVCSDFDPNA